VTELSAPRPLAGFKYSKRHSEFDPSDAPVKRRSAECPHCDIVIEEDEVERKIREGEYEYSVYGVNYETENGERKFRAGSEVDEDGMEKAAERVESDFDLMTFMTEPVDISSRKSDPTIYGMEEWRDTYTPRQLVVHFEYYDAYQEQKNTIEHQRAHHSIGLGGAWEKWEMLGEWATKLIDESASNENHGAYVFRNAVRDVHNGKFIDTVMKANQAVDEDPKQIFLDMLELNTYESTVSLD